MKINAVIRSVFGYGSLTNNDKRHLTYSGPGFTQQLTVFHQLGFALNPGIVTSDIDRRGGGHADFEYPPFRLMYRTLASTIERTPFTPLTDKVVAINLKAIEDHGGYIRIMNEISRITNGELGFENLTDYVDIEASIAWVAFTCSGDSYKCFLSRGLVFFQVDDKEPYMVNCVLSLFQ